MLIKTTARKGFWLWLGLLVVLSLSSCYESPEQPLGEGLIEEEKLVALMADIHLAEGYLADVAIMAEKDSLAAIYYGTIFEKHKVDSVIFDRTLENYMQNPTALAQLYEKILERLQTKDAESRKN
jgi:hypothetical protein